MRVKKQSTIKGVISLILIIIFMLPLCISVNTAESAPSRRVAFANCTTGGTTGCLDRINGNFIQAGTLAIVITSTQPLFYYGAIAACVGGEDPAGIERITPDTDGTTKCWNRAKDFGPLAIDLDELQNVGAMTEVRGDILYYTNSAEWNRLALGTSAQILSSDGTDIAWVTMSGDASIVNGVVTVAGDGHVHLVAGFTSGSINGVVVGDVTPAAGTFTAVTVPGAGDLATTGSMIVDGSGSSSSVTLGATQEVSFYYDATNGGIAYTMLDADGFSSTVPPKKWFHSRSLVDDLNANDTCDLAASGGDCFTIPDVTSFGWLECQTLGGLSAFLSASIGGNGAVTIRIDTETTGSTTLGTDDKLIIHDCGSQACVMNELGFTQTIRCEFTYD